MDKIINAFEILQKTPLPIILALAGILFLLLAFVERIGAIMTLPPKRRKQALAMGIMLLFCGVGLYALPAVTSSLEHPDAPSFEETSGAHTIYEDALSFGYDMGVNTSGGVTNWVHSDIDGMCMDYPSNQEWGAVFITVGSPRDPPRPSRDLSAFKRLSIELRGSSGGEYVSIGIKSNSDPDDGLETKVLVTGLTTTWTRYEWPLSKFVSADLQNIYVPVEFVFDGAAKSVCFRNVSYLP